MPRAAVSRENSLGPDVPNPFVHRINLSTLDKIQVVLMSIFVVPIRLVFMAFWLVLGWSFAALSMYGRKEEEKKQPLSGWRDILRPGAVFCCRMLFWVGGFFWVTVRGNRVSSSEATILATAPHSTYMDGLFVTFVDLSTVVAKRSTEKIPFFGSLTNFTQPVYVSREDPNSRVNTIKEIQERAQSKGKWPQIVIFPEGTCTNRKCLISFKPGAFIPGVPVQPVCLRYSNRMDTTTWTWDGPGALTILWLTLCNFHTSLEVQYLPTYYPSEEEKIDAKLFANNVRDKMAAALGVPVTDHTFEDCRLMAYASKLDKLDMPAATGLLDLSKIMKKLGIKSADTVSRLCELAQNNETDIKKQTLAEYLAVSEPAAELDKLMAFYDQEKSGTIDFRDFVMDLHLLSRPENCEDTTKLAFQVYDHGAKGGLTQDELERVVTQVFGMNDVDVEQLFGELQEDGMVTFDLLKSYAGDDEHHEFAHLFMEYQKAAEMRDEELNNSLLNTMTRSKAE